jgi:hypothetical protein
MMIDLLKFEGYHLANQKAVEKMVEVDFSIVRDLPNCALKDEILNCDNNNQITEIATLVGMFHIIIDPNDKMIVTDHENYLVFTEKTLYLKTRVGEVPLSYRSLPKGWQTFDFAEMKASAYPEDELTNYFIAGLNELIKEYTGLGVVFLLFYGFFSVLLKVLLISLVFTLFFKGLGHKFRVVFRVAVFALTLPTLLGLITKLLGFNLFGPTLLTFIAFIYIYKGLSPIQKIEPKESE